MLLHSQMKELNLNGLSREQYTAIAHVLEGRSIFLTGPAGTGKSHTINIMKALFKVLAKRCYVTSTTGTSAIQVEGTTIHSWSGIGICGSIETAMERVGTYRKPKERIRCAQVLIIDEISMMSSNLFEIIEHVCRAIRCDTRPFGGIQIVAVGDFYQLSPVKADKYAFESPKWNIVIEHMVQLTKIFRQKNSVFSTALNEIRTGNVSQKTKELIESRIGIEFEGDIKATELYPLKIDVESLNEEKLWELATEENPVIERIALDELVERPKPKRSRPMKYILQCKERLNKYSVAPEKLCLCVGAQVMLTKNLNVAAGFANGSLGVVVGFDLQYNPVVKFLNGHTVVIMTEVTSMRISETSRIKRRQYPLILAWAITIHKSQGSSIDRLKVDLSNRIFDDGQTYTAISRCRTLEGLSVIDIDWGKVTVNPKVAMFYCGKYVPEKCN